MRRPFRIGAAVVVLFALTLWGVAQFHRSFEKGQALILMNRGLQFQFFALQEGYPASFPVETVQEYVAALIVKGPLREIDLPMLSAPKGPSTTTLGGLSGSTVAFTIYRVGPDDPPGTLFLVSKSGAVPGWRIEVPKLGGPRCYDVSRFPALVAPPPKAIPPTFLP